MEDDPDRQSAWKGGGRKTNANTAPRQLLRTEIWRVVSLRRALPFVAPPPFSNAAAQLLRKGGSHLARQQARVRLVLARVLPHVDEHVRVRRATEARVVAGRVPAAKLAAHRHALGHGRDACVVKLDPLRAADGAHVGHVVAAAEVPHVREYSEQLVLRRRLG